MIAHKKIVFRLMLLAGLFGLVLFTLAQAAGKSVQAEAGDQPLLQSTGYPYPGDYYTPDPNATEFPTSVPIEDYPWPGENFTPPPFETSTATATLPSGPTPTTPQFFTPTPTLTLIPGTTREPTLPVETATLLPSGSTQVPIPGGATRTGETGTPQPERTRTRYVFTPDPTPVKGGFQVDWGVFWVGFSIPVLVTCGVVLYLLDRQPGFFSRSYKK